MNYRNYGKNRIIIIIFRTDKYSILGGGVMQFFSYDKHIPNEDEIKIKGQTEFLNLIKQAKKDWQLSQKLLSEVTDCDLMDYVIYSIKANEARYRYLLKNARLQNLQGDAWTGENFNDI